MSHLNQNTPSAISSFNLENLHNLPIPLQALVKASHYLSIVNAEIHKMPESRAFNYELVIAFTALLGLELEQISLLFLDNNAIQNLAKPLPSITIQLLKILLANNDMSLSELKNMVRSYHGIGDSLMIISGIALYQHMGSK